VSEPIDGEGTSQFTLVRRTRHLHICPACDRAYRCRVLACKAILFKVCVTDALKAAMETERA
jgi:hypothetical protein